jgi:hypothetical protein
MPNEGSFLPNDSDYAELSIVNNVIALSLPTQNAWVLINTGWTSIVSTAGFTVFPAGGSITARLPRALLLEPRVTLAVGAGALAIEVGVFKNGAALADHIGQRTIQAAATVTMNVSGIEPCLSGDVFDLRARCTSAAAVAITISYGNFTIVAL